MGGFVKGYHKLEIYQLSHSLALKIHKLSLVLPKFEMYEEGSQIRKSSKSVSSNIVEGFALRKYKNEYLHYLYRSYGSSEETVENLRYLFETGSFGDKGLHEELIKEYLRLNGMIFNFIMSVERTFDTPAFLIDSENMKRDTRNLNPGS